MRRSIRIDYDSTVRVLPIEVHTTRIVLLHALFESYDGFAVVRTIDESRGIVSIIATESTEDLCWQLLESLRSTVDWRISDLVQIEDHLFDYKKLGI